MNESMSSYSGGVCVAPINDIRGLEGMSYTKNEKALRCRLAAAYRLADFQGWTQGINNHISLRISQVSIWTWISSKWICIEVGYFDLI